MPVIIKNGKTYGDRSVTLSQAEYNALSEVEKNNGTCYYIYDVNGVVTADDVALDNGTVETLAGSVATIESSPATAIHAVGDFILWNGQLYTVTSAIAVGQTLTVGSNITATSAGSEITEIKSGLTTYQELPITQLKTPTRADILRGYRIGKIAVITFNNVSYSEGFSTDTAVITIPTPVLPIRGIFYDQTRTFISYYVNTYGDVLLNGYTSGRLIYGTIIYPIYD